MKENATIHRSSQGPSVIQLRALNERLWSLIEQEKARAAQDIHNGLAQNLTVLALELSMLEAQAEETDPELDRTELRQRIRSFSELVATMIQAVRRLAVEMRPKVLDEFGLGAALEWQSREFTRQTGIRCRVSVPPAKTLDRRLSTGLFRLFQEILSNIRQHSKASSVEVSLSITPACIALKVRDNGRGLSRKQLRDPKALGLLAMKERAAALGGVLAISGKPRRGTQVRIRVPLSNRARGSRASGQPIPPPSRLTQKSELCRES